MALKAVVTAAEHAALAEPLKTEYVQKDGNYILALDGELPDVREMKVKLAEFRDNNRNMHGELEKLRPLATKFDGVDPDEYRKLKDQVAKLKAKGISDPDQAEDDIDKRIKAANAPILAKLEQEEKRRQEAEQRMLDQDYEKKITDVALKAGLRPQAVDVAVARARQKFELKDGELTPKAGVKNVEEPHKDYTTKEWLAELAKSDSYLFEPSDGGGAEGSRGKKSGAQILMNPSPEELGRNMDAIASGKMQVVRS
jgi:hypothetical protein